MYCNICFEPIYIVYYKGKCKCNVRYHYGCVINWYKEKKKCIICQKPDKIEINILHYRYNKYITSLILIFMTLLLVSYYIITLI